MSTKWTTCKDYKTKRQVKDEIHTIELVRKNNEFVVIVNTYCKSKEGLSEWDNLLECRELNELDAIRLYHLLVKSDIYMDNSSGFTMIKTNAYNLKTQKETGKSICINADKYKEIVNKELTMLGLLYCEEGINFEKYIDDMLDDTEIITHSYENGITPKKCAELLFSIHIHPIIF